MALRREHTQCYPSLAKLREDNVREQYNRDLIQQAIEFIDFYLGMSTKERENFGKDLTLFQRKNERFRQWLSDNMQALNVKTLSHLANFAEEFRIEALENVCYYLIAQQIDGRKDTEIRALFQGANNPGKEES